MIVEPVPAGPRGPLHRVAGMLGLLAPIVVLIAVVGAAAAGRSADAVPGESPSASAWAASVASPAPSVRSGPVPPVAFPRTAFGLPVVDVTDALTLARSGRAPSVLAIAGHLRYRSTASPCPPTGYGPYDPLCHRFGVLAASPIDPAPSGDGPGIPWRMGAHLHPQFPVGTPLPREVRTTLRGGSVPVVLIARFDDPRAIPCEPGGRHCGEELVVERVAWVEGREWFRATLLDPLLDIDRDHDEWRARRRSAIAVMPGTPAVLTAALLSEPTLARVDPAVGAVLHGRPLEAVWYLRALEPAPTPRVVWAVVDDATGELLASGPRAPGG